MSKLDNHSDISVKISKSHIILTVQFMEMRKDMVVRNEFEQLKFRLSDASLQLLPEYKERLKVLHELHYTDLHDTVQLKVCKTIYLFFGIRCTIHWPSVCYLNTGMCTGTCYKLENVSYSN